MRDLCVLQIRCKGIACRCGVAMHYLARSYSSKGEVMDKEALNEPLY